VLGFQTGDLAFEQSYAFLFGLQNGFDGFDVGGGLAEEFGLVVTVGPPPFYLFLYEVIAFKDF
jgi:hypothetical protein